MDPTLFSAACAAAQADRDLAVASPYPPVQTACAAAQVGLGGGSRPPVSQSQTAYPAAVSLTILDMVLSGLLRKYFSRFFHQPFDLSSPFRFHLNDDPEGGAGFPRSPLFREAALIEAQKLYGFLSRAPKMDFQIFWIFLSPGAAYRVSPGTEPSGRAARRLPVSTP